MDGEVIPRITSGQLGMSGVSSKNRVNVQENGQNHKFDLFSTSNYSDIHKPEKWNSEAILGLNTIFIYFENCE